MSEKDAKFYFNKGTLYNDEGKYSLAIDNFKTALSFDPTSVETHFNLGVAYINKKEFDSAIKCFQIVLTTNPNEIAALNNLALAYGRKREFNRAIDYYKQVLFMIPDDAGTLKDLGDIYTKNRQYDSAIVCYQKALQANPCSNIVKASLNTAINLKNNENLANKAIEQDNQYSINKTDESSKDYFNLAVDYIKEQNFDAAIDNLRNCLKTDPDFPNACQLLDKLFKVKEKLYSDKAQKKNLKLVTQNDIPEKENAEQNPLFIDYRQYNEFYTLGFAYYNAKNYNSALENFKKCLEVNPNDKDCHNYIQEITSKIRNSY